MMTGKRIKKDLALKTLVESGLKPVKSAVPGLTMYELLVIACNQISPESPQSAYDLLYNRLRRIHGGAKTASIGAKKDPADGPRGGEDGGDFSEHAPVDPSFLGGHY